MPSAFARLICAHGHMTQSRTRLLRTSHAQRLGTPQEHELQLKSTLNAAQQSMRLCLMHYEHKSHEPLKGAHLQHPPVLGVGQVPDAVVGFDGVRQLPVQHRLLALQPHLPPCASTAQLLSIPSLVKKRRCECHRVAVGDEHCKPTTGLQRPKFACDDSHPSMQEIFCQKAAPKVAT